MIEAAAARRYETASGPALSGFVFHETGARLGDWRKRWGNRVVRRSEVPGLGSFTTSAGRRSEI